MKRLLIVAAGVLAVALVSRYDSDKQGSVDAPPRAEVGRRATTTDRLTFLIVGVLVRPVLGPRAVSDVQGRPGGAALLAPQLPIP